MNASSENLAARLETAVAAARVSGDPEICADYAIDELAPRAVVSPASAAEAAEVVRWAKFAPQGWSRVWLPIS